jgi:stearoyl-CoA desaturase (delta-9 desaturase)
MKMVVISDNQDEQSVRAETLRLRVTNLAVVLIPFAGLLAAFVLLWGVAFNWIYLALLGGMYLLTGLGVTVGFHRLFTHRSFKASAPVTVVFAALGSMAFEGPLLHWAALHRCHHQHSDEPKDPHSPHMHGTSFWGMLRGFWHSHMGWMFVPNPPGLKEYVQDLRRDPLIRWMNHLFPLWALLGLLIPAAVGGLITRTWMGFLLGFIWGGLVRILLIHHMTWSINSVCHIWGTRPFRSHDKSRNNAIMGIIGFGEGWHNNHHAFPTSARHGLRWWEFDLSYLVIRAMARLGLARDVRLPTANRMADKRIERS